MSHSAPTPPEAWCGSTRSATGGGRERGWQLNTADVDGGVYAVPGGTYPFTYTVTEPLGTTARARAKIVVGKLSLASSVSGSVEPWPTEPCAPASPSSYQGLGRPLVGDQVVGVAAHQRGAEHRDLLGSARGQDGGGDGGEVA